MRVTYLMRTLGRNLTSHPQTGSPTETVRTEISDMTTEGLGDWREVVRMRPKSTIPLAQYDVPQAGKQMQHQKKKDSRNSDRRRSSFSKRN